MNPDRSIQEFEVTEEYDGLRIDKYLSLIFADQSRTFFQKLIGSGDVLIRGRAASKNSMPVEAGDLIRVNIPETVPVVIKPEDIPLDILYEDDDLLVVNKPKGMVVHPSPGHYEHTLVNAVLFHCRDSLSGINGELRPGIVHRIDKDTTGSLIVCKNDRTHAEISRQIGEHTVKRLYRGIVCGLLPEDEGMIDAPIARHPTNRKRMTSGPYVDGKPAVTHYTVLERFGRYTYAEFRLETGRTHQIRVHMADVAHHPLLGDELYGGMNKDYAVKGLDGQTLHAMTIGFVHPSSGEYMEFSAPLPEYFEGLLGRFRG